jgi:hypothetical protein
VALIVTAATLLANRSVVVVPGTSIQFRNGLALAVFDLAWTTLTVLWFAQIFGKHLGATNPDRYLEEQLVWRASPEQLAQGASMHPLTHAEIWRELRSAHRERRHPGGPKPATRAARNAASTW